MKTAKIQIAPVIGSPDNVARDLQTQLASAIGNRGMTVATAANATSEYVVRGYIVAAREKTKAKISYIWDVTDQSGKRVHRITGEEVAVGAGKDPWAAVTPQVVQRIADKTATQLATWLPGAAGTPVATNSTPVVGEQGATETKSAAAARRNQRRLPDGRERTASTGNGSDDRQHRNFGTDYRARADSNGRSGRRRRCVDCGYSA